MRPNVFRCELSSWAKMYQDLDDRFLIKMLVVATTLGRLEAIGKSGAKTSLGSIEFR